MFIKYAEHTRIMFMTYQKRKAVIFHKLHLNCMFQIFFFSRKGKH